MSLSLASHILFINPDTNLTIVRVQSLKCHYRVALEEDTITIYGPGVEETYNPWEGEIFLQRYKTMEARAIACVLLFEEEE